MDAEKRRFIKSIRKEKPFIFQWIKIKGGKAHYIFRGMNGVFAICNIDISRAKKEGRCVPDDPLCENCLREIKRQEAPDVK